jgi:hypothetical protein
VHDRAIARRREIDDLAHGGGVFVSSDDKCAWCDLTGSRVHRGSPEVAAVTEREDRSALQAVRSHVERRLFARPGQIFWTVDRAQILSFRIYGDAHHGLAVWGLAGCLTGFAGRGSMLPAELPAAALSPPQAATSAT